MGALIASGNTANDGMGNQVWVYAMPLAIGNYKVRAKHVMGTTWSEQQIAATASCLLEVTLAVTAGGMGGPPGG